MHEFFFKWYNARSMNVERQKPTKKNRTTSPNWQRIRHTGRILLFGLSLTACGSPINMDTYSTVVAREEQPTATPRRGLFDTTAIPLEKTPAATSTPEIDPNHKILFGLIELDNQQRLAIRATTADVEFEIGSSPNATPLQ